MDEFTGIVKKKYEEIEKQEGACKAKLAALAQEKAPLAAYLVKVGDLKAKTRNRKPGPASTGPG
jgi:prefoldin subunit 5